MMPKQIVNRVRSLALAILMALAICGCVKKYDKETVIHFTQVFMLCRDQDHLTVT